MTSIILDAASSESLHRLPPVVHPAPSEAKASQHLRGPSGGVILLDSDGHSAHDDRRTPAPQDSGCGGSATEALNHFRSLQHPGGVRDNASPVSGWCRLRAPVPRPVVSATTPGVILNSNLSVSEFSAHGGVMTPWALEVN